MKDATATPQNGASVELPDKAISLPKENRDGDKEFEMHMLDGYGR